MKNKISACFGFNSNAHDAALYHTAVFQNAGISDIVRNTKSSPAGEEDSVLAVSYFVEDFEFLALNAGPQFSPNPSISFFVHCSNEEEVNGLWEKLSEGGHALMPLNTYPFSKRYGWIQDKYGVSWQLILPQREVSRKIVPCLLFTQEQFGNAEKAMDFYVSVFRNSSRGFISRYGSQGSNPEAINYGALQLEGQDFVVMESDLSHDFHFSEGVSLMVHCKDQDEVDNYWEQLKSHGGEEGQCGWLKDQFGVSWQVVPDVWIRLISQKDRAKADRYMQAMIRMKKLDIAALEAAGD